MSTARCSPSIDSTWDSMLPGPPSGNNFGSLDISRAGLLAFPSGSSISIVDSRSLQLISTVPLPPPPPSSSSSSSSLPLSPFITAVRWTLLHLHRDLLSTEPSSSHLLRAVADLHGRIALLDFRLKSVILWFEPDPTPKCGVQDISWILSRTDSYVLAAISGPSTLSLYTTSAAVASSSAWCFFKYDASPELLSCIRRDPFDSRHFGVIGFKGFLLSVKLLGETETEVALKEYHIPTDSSELERLARDAANTGTISSSSSPASATFPRYSVKLAFSPQWKHISKGAGGV